MNDLLSPLDNRRRAVSSFFVRCGQAGRTARNKRCEHTAPLFPLILILDADGALADDARPLIERISA